MGKKIKHALKQLRKALHEQREYELLLRAESTHRYDTFVEKLIPLIPFLVSKFGSSANGATSASAQASQILLLAKLVRSLTDDQVAAIQKHLSIEQKKHLLELLHSLTSASQETSPSAAQAAPHSTGAGPPADPPNAPVRHWFYPSSVIGCGLNMDDLPAKELTCLRHEVTCSGCLARLRADHEKADATASNEQPGQEEILNWIAVPYGNGTTDHSVTWHTTPVPIKLDGMSNVVAPKTILTSCVKAVPCYQISRTTRQTPVIYGQDRFCASCTPGEGLRAT